MTAAGLIGRLAREAPVASMTRGAVEHVLSPAFLGPPAERARAATRARVLNQRDRSPYSCMEP